VPNNASNDALPPLPDPSTVGSALHDAEQSLEAAGIVGARLEATLLLGHVLGHSRVQLLAALSDPLTQGQVSSFSTLINRRANREPLQYLRSSAPFLDFDLEVHPGVFIPRPETEHLVERTLELWDPTDGWAIDVGTGSGAIAIGLARGKPEGHVLAVDQSRVALNVTVRNATRLGVHNHIAFVQGNFLRALALSPDNIGIIVSNPPYIADNDEVDPEVRHHEPRKAWAAGPTGMEAYDRIIPESAALLRPGFWLVLELGYGQEEVVRSLIRESDDWGNPHVQADSQGIPRVLAVPRKCKP
jgi:release factor glutamine methyltransferase